MPKFEKGHVSWLKGKKLGFIPKMAFKEGHIPWSKGKKLLNITGENHYLWKGDKAGYAAIHIWVKKEFGKPDSCENKSCVYPRLNSHGKILSKPYRFEWANISGNYKRERNDWMKLCTSCHRIRDKRKRKEAEEEAKKAEKVK